MFVPAGDTKGRPLLVLLHGRSSSPDTMAKKSITDAIGKLGSRAPVVVFANGGNHSYYHDRADGRWGSYILQEVIPAAIRKYELDGRRVAIGGFSMGGFGALDLARFQRFCAVGGHSAAMWSSGGETPEGAFDHAEDFEQNDIIERAAGEPAPLSATPGLDRHRHRRPVPQRRHEELARNSVRRALPPLARRPRLLALRARRPEVMRFYANALARC